MDRGPSSTRSSVKRKRSGREVMDTLIGSKKRRLNKDLKINKRRKLKINIVPDIEDM